MGAPGPLAAAAGPALRGPGEEEIPIGDPEPDDGDWDDDDIDEDDADDDEADLDLRRAAPARRVRNLIQSAPCGAPPRAR